MGHIPGIISDYGDLDIVDTDRTEHSHIPIKGKNIAIAN